jgi:signal transduction histidine kinase
MTEVTYQDIQNKLTALIGYAALSKTPNSEPERIAYIDKQMEILEMIQNLIKKTKDYQQMGIDRSRWIGLEETIRMQMSLQSQKHAVSLLCDLSGLEIFTDPLITRVFYNLIHNAIRHGGGISRITFSCSENPSGLLLVCEDDGVGIPSDEKLRLFDRVVGGAGKFGLFFVREFLTLSGMTIRETGIPGRGARSRSRCLPACTGSPHTGNRTTCLPLTPTRLIWGKPLLSCTRYSPALMMHEPGNGLLPAFPKVPGWSGS